MLHTVRQVLRAAAAALLFVFACGTATPQPIGRTDPNRGLFPDSSIVDFSFLLDAPAGKNGFLQVDKNGHFAWPDGRRARFWGVNISSRSVFVDTDTIDKVVDVLARAGTNMVRFEALDSYDGLLDIPGRDTSRRINPRRVQRLDYWIARLRDKGIYYYLDLLDFRQFKSEDGVAGYDEIGRAAKPYGFFDRRLIELQKEYARQLLTHRNPLTGLRYIDDPALALVEVCNEHGMFMKAESLDNLVSPYGWELRQMWNRWLMRQYGSREGLRGAWGSIGEVAVLGDGEDPAANSVALPDFTTPPSNGQQSQESADVRRAPARLRDGVRFLYEVQRGYLRDMKEYLHSLGVKVPITAAMSNEIVPDVASAGAEMDFTCENYYADHPAFAGKDWEGSFFLNDTNPIRNSSTYQVAPWLSALRWDSKPVVVREWATVWPNHYRAIAIPEMAAYASLQDFDAILLFGYQVVRDPDALRDFDHQADPPVWGLFGMGALAFLRHDIRPAPYSATLVYTPDTLFRWPNLLGNLHRLSWFVRLNSTYIPEARVVSRESRVVRPHRSFRPRPKRQTAEKGKSGPAGAKRPPLALSHDLRVSPADPSILGGTLDLFAMAGAPVHSRMLETGTLVASNGQIARRTQDGLLMISTPRTVALCGEFPVHGAAQVGSWGLTTQTGVGALMAVSLDGKPLDRSTSYLVKMVSRAENTDQELEAAQEGAPARFRIKNWGKAPVLTFGRQCDLPTVVRHGSQNILSLALIDGTWELWVRSGIATLVCDTSNIPGSLFGHPITTQADVPITVSLVVKSPGASRAAGSRSQAAGARKQAVVKRKPAK